ncbi:MAG: CHAP domain-containing protein [Clostridiales bacterium]|nr:CHAP domain-containing protein [Candidatus Crickella equi]
MENYMSDEQIRRKILAEKQRKRARRRVLIIVIALILAVVDGLFIGKLIGNKRYEAQSENLISVTEDMPLINTAKEQIGNLGGQKFWSWYGYDSHVSWCGCFVSYCENKSGVGGPKFAYVPDGVDAFKSKGRWLEAGEKPEPGDIIFFDWEQDGGRDHTGIVSAVVDDKVYTIEGNSSDRCRIKRYYLDDKVIYGYGQQK